MHSEHAGALRLVSLHTLLPSWAYSAALALPAPAPAAVAAPVTLVDIVSDDTNQLQGLLPLPLGVVSHPDSCYKDFCCCCCAPTLLSSSFFCSVSSDSCLEST